MSLSVRPLLLAAALLLPSMAAWSAPALPSKAPDSHLGAASCSGSSCHGVEAGNGGTVQQNEFLIWSRRDDHAKAYKVLQSEAGRRIARNLGLASATGPECLACHSDPVAAAQRGKRYRAEEGVSCEACHGGGERWMGPHVAGTADRKTLLAAGLYPTWEPAARAALCLSCHQSSNERPVDHKLFGAGHPPLNRFELDAYSATQPAHHRVDADYRRRKPVAGSGEIWLAGQLTAALNLLDELQSPRFAQHGAFPELAFYDCDACHHPMDSLRFGGGAGTVPGQVRLYDVPLVLTGQALSALAPDAVVSWNIGLEQLRRAAGQSVDGVREPARRLREQLAGLMPGLVAQGLSAAQIGKLQTQIANEAQQRGAASYGLAAQATMALASLADQGGASAARKAGLDALFKATASSKDYKPEAFVAALKKLPP